MPFSNEPIIEVKNASIQHEKRVVLDGVNFEIEKGEFVYLIGRTGSGKSSMMKTLYADLPLIHGQMKVASFELLSIQRSQVPYLRRKVGIIFQDFQLFMDRNVAENLTFVMKATGWNSGAKMKDRIAEVLMRVGLGAVSNKKPHQLSGGEQQRVVIARALLNEPLILFADEPTGNLDPVVAKEILKVFKDVNRSGTAVLMATHNYDFLKDDPTIRVLKCENGQVLDSKKVAFSLGGEL
ncbi:MAG: ATP-binding cassette domain-containing protein [Bacteroidota bacterium]